MSDDEEIVLTLDIGSSSIRCGAYKVIGDSKVERLEGCFASRVLRTVEPNTGKIELRTEHGKSLLDEIDAIVDETLENLRKYPTSARVVGMGFASFCMNLIAVDASGIPVGKEATLSYACSTPTVADVCKRLKSELGTKREDELYQRTGSPLHSSYALPQLRELYTDSEKAHVVSRIVVWQTLASACISRWMGTPFSHISFSEASWTGLFNFRTLEWDKEAIALLPDECRSHMPPLCDYWDDAMPSGGIRVESGELGPSRNPYWDRWPEMRGLSELGDSKPCRLFFGLGDGACANIGSRCSTNQMIAVTIGTTAAARVCIPLRPGTDVDYFRVPKGLFCYRLDRFHVVVGGALTDGGSVIEWSRQLLNLRDDTEFDNCLAKVEQLLQEDYENSLRGLIDPSAISLVPFLSGERSLGYRDGASLCLTGMTRTSTSAHFVKACLEGVVLRLEVILRLLQKVVEKGRRKPQIVASGAALEKNPLWRQMLADCSGLQVQLDTSLQESTSQGVATMLAVAMAMRRDMTIESASYLTSNGYTKHLAFSSPLLLSTEGYWLVALEAQENLLDAVSTLW